MPGSCAQPDLIILERGSAPLEPGHQQGQLPAFHQCRQDCFGSPVQGIQDRVPIDSSGCCHGWIVTMGGQTIVEGEWLLAVLTLAEGFIQGSDLGMAAQLGGGMEDVVLAESGAS